jgi:hypothetical protein
MLLTGITPPDFDGVKVRRSEFCADGYLTWIPISTTGENEEIQERRFENMWKSCLDGINVPEDHVATGVLNDFSILMQKGISVTTAILEASRQSHPPVQYIKELGLTEATIEAELKLMGSRFSTLVPIVNFLSLMRENIIVEGLGPNAEETREIYRIGKQLVCSL